MNQMSRHKLMQYVQETGFAVDDIVLYLDTHPKDREALMYYKKYKKMYQEACREYEKYYGPLQNKKVDTEYGWSWVKEPWPWEGGC